jgi:hypothetical protein
MSSSPKWTRIDNATVLRAWAIAEATSGKEGFAQAVAQQAPKAIRDKVFGGKAETLTDSEWRLLEGGIRQYRAPMLDHLLALGVDWFDGLVPVAELENMRFFNLPKWVSGTRSRRFGDLAGSRAVAGSAPEFRGFSTTIERPIAVGPSLAGPLCLLEGYTRCGALVRDHRAGLSPLESIPIIVGVCPRITEWTNGAGHRWW